MALANHSDLVAAIQAFMMDRADLAGQRPISSSSARR